MMLHPTTISTRAPFAILSVLLLIGTACENRPPVSQTEGGRLVLGKSAVEQIVERGVAPGGRTLELYGFKGTVTLDGSDEAEARLTFVKQARGKDEEAARKVLQRISINETGSAATFQYVVDAERRDVSRVDVLGTVPHGTPQNIPPPISRHLAALRFRCLFN